MFTKIFSATLKGINCEIVEVETDIYNSFNPGISIVGLPDKAVEESRERIRMALKNSDITLPRKRFIVNLAPANIRKEGPAYDLPIAVSLLCATGILKNDFGKKSLFIGEVSLSGELRPVYGLMAIVTELLNKGFQNIFIPFQNKEEVSIIKGIDIYPVKNIKQLIDHLLGHKLIEKIIPKDFQVNRYKNFYCDFQDIKGQEFAKRALEIAAAGGHNVIMIGPPGSGKTLLARSMPSILPPLSFQEVIEVTKIFSVANVLSSHNPLIVDPPFRSPHHTSSGVSLVGGGRFPKPGEISLAHRGVLFLDEIAEFPKNVLENLRQPLEDHIVTISRAEQTIEYPANFILICAMNPCPCGFWGDLQKNCVCSQYQLEKYQKKISGPLLDRIDLYVSVQRVEVNSIFSEEKKESSFDIRQRVIKAREIQKERYKNYQNVFLNSDLNTKLLTKYCQLDQEVKRFLNNAVEKLNLSARSYTRILKVSRTIADLDNSERVLEKHLAEALQFRKLPLKR